MVNSRDSSTKLSGKQSFANHLDRRIYKAIAGHTIDNPQNLVGILAYVDSQEKMLMTHEELAGGLRRLIESKLISGSKGQSFFDFSSTVASGEFSVVSLDEYETAVQAYQSWFDTMLKQDDPGSEFTHRKVIIRWKLNGDRYGNNEDEDATEAFADTIGPALAKSGLAEINGFEYASGVIDILVFGKEADDDVDDVYALVVGAFKSYGCPPGSCLIKCYHQARRDVCCDEIA